MAAWTNLGLLYIHCKDLALAEEALVKAQLIDPDYTLAWLGHAVVATYSGNDQKGYDILNHAVTLPHPVVSTIFRQCCVS